jgi:hypothetical protein
MTTTQHIQLASSDERSFQPIVARLAEPALAVLLFALVTGAWLAYFMVVPLDFSALRGH